MKQDVSSCKHTISCEQVFVAVRPYLEAFKSFSFTAEATHVILHTMLPCSPLIECHLDGLYRVTLTCIKDHTGGLSGQHAGKLTPCEG